MKNLFGLLLGLSIYVMAACNSGRTVTTSRQVVARDTVEKEYEIEDKVVEKTVIVDTTTNKREVEIKK